MTLLIAAGRPDVSVLVADRRLSAARGRDVRLVDDDSTKAGSLHCRDARLGYAFCGLASVGNPPPRGPAPRGSFRTSQWLVEAISASAVPEREIDPLLERFREKAEETINDLPVPHPNKGLAVIFVGHRGRNDGGIETYTRVVHNTPADDPISSTPRFRITDPSEGWRAGYVVAVGMRAAWTADKAKAIGALVEAGKPAEAVRGKMLTTLEEVADDTRSQERIGKQASSLVIPAEPSLPVLGRYHSARIAERAYFPDTIEARGGSHGEFVTMDGTLVGETETGRQAPVAGPKLGRNRLCWCGSGEKYKRCHGR